MTPERLSEAERHATLLRMSMRATSASARLRELADSIAMGWSLVVDAPLAASAASELVTVCALDSELSVFSVALDVIAERVRCSGWPALSPATRIAMAFSASLTWTRKGPRR